MRKAVKAIRRTPLLPLEREMGAAMISPRHFPARLSVASSIAAAVLAAVSAMGAASVNLQISLDDPPYALLVIVCLLPILDFCAPAAWKRLERAGLVSPARTGGTEERTFTGKTQDQLKDMCRDYGLAVSGNKTRLKTCLQEFSERFCNDPADCNLAPVKRRSHKGPRDGPKKTQPKQSASRRAAIIDTERVTERSKDTRTTDEMKNLLLWADRTLARLPYKPPKSEILPILSVPEGSSQGGLSDRSLHDRMQTIESQLAAIAASGIRGTYQASAPSEWTSTSSASFTAYPMPPTDYIVYDHTESTQDFFPNYDTANFYEHVRLQENILINIPSDVNWSHTSDYQNLHIGQTFDCGYSTAPTLPSAPPQAVIPTTSAPAPCVPSAQSHSTPNVSTRSVKLGDNTIITITVDEVKQIAVPATSFAEDIERLNQMWDDTSPHWKDDSVVKIDTHSIALVYWPEIFKKTGLWSAHKSNWTEWKFLIERYRQGTPDEFWTTFISKDGGKMSYTAICASLRKERKNADQNLADRARLEYGEEFEVKFSYRCSKTNAQVVMSKASSIAKEYKRLHAL
ncbi:hypothetical protein B0H10DRAFT_2214073 [Mycena sp. CBHHK59/15]|nr:hypothetical protein B0H10DRAFT_2214073 [Mycena sp. CBHHK59/15]